jgi:hypothetical protein
MVTGKCRWSGANLACGTAREDKEFILDYLSPNSLKETYSIGWPWVCDDGYIRM